MSKQEDGERPRWDYQGENHSFPDDPAEARQHEILEHPETMEYLTELYPRLRRLADRVTTLQLKPEEVGSLEWGREVGLYWWRARANLHISRSQVVNTMGAPVNSVRFLELGLGEETELNISFLSKYAGALGHTELYHQYEQRFNPSKPPQL